MPGQKISTLDFSTPIFKSVLFNYKLYNHKVVKHLGPSFGGINLEDIKGPNCFYIEEQLKKLMNSVKRLEKRKDGVHTFKSAGIGKQADYLMELEDWLQEDLRDALEEEMGTLSDSIEAVGKAGENKESNQQV